MLIDESDNPAHCHKTTMAVTAARHARKLGFACLTAGSCGNYGLALALAARDSGLTAVVCIPRRYSSTPQIQAIKDAGSYVVRRGDTYEDAVENSRRLATDRSWADCNPDGPLDAVLLDGLAAQIEGRIRALPEPPDTLWLPLGNGTTALAAVGALDRLGIPCRVVAVTSRGNNAVLSSWQQGRYELLAPGDLRETSVNEPLCNWDAMHGPALLAKADGWLSVIGAPDSDLVRAATTLRRLRGVRYTPSGSAGYAGYASTRQRSARHAILLTARELKAATT